jgi:iron complex transport system ATP-binding protein
VPIAREEGPALELKDVWVVHPRRLVSAETVAMPTPSAASPSSADLRPAVAGVSLQLQPGGITAVLGPNGAGKSTLLRVAAGLIHPSRGEVLSFGIDVRRRERRALARIVALVTQTEAPAAFRVREVVAMGRAPHQDGWLREKADDRDAVMRALNRCDLVHLADRRVDTLSGGEQRRVVVARALAQEPRLLLLDEPASFLDVRHRLDLHALIAELAAQQGVAVVIATHDLDEAARLASQVVLLREGRVVVQGRPSDAMTSSHLLEAFDAEFDVRSLAAGDRERPIFVPLSPRVKARVE